MELSELVIPIKMGALAGVGAVMGGLGAVAGAILGTTDAAKGWADELDGLSTKTGLAVNEAAGLAVIAKETGISTEDAAKSLGFMNKGLVDSEGKLGATGKALDALGISVKNVDGSMKSTAQITQEAATAIQNMTDPAARARAEMAVFGKAGTDLDDTLSALANGGLTEATSKAQEMGLAVGGEGVSNAEEMQKNMADLQMTLQGFAVTIGGALIPILNQVMPIMTEALNRPEVKAAIDAVMQALVQLLNAILPLLPAFLPLIVSILPPLTNLLLMVVSAIVPLISTILPPLIQLAIMLITALMPIISAVLPPLISLFTKVISAIMPLLMQVLPPLITLVATLITAFMPLLEAILPPLTELFTLWVGVLMDIIDAVLPPLTDLIGGLTDKFNEWLPVVQNVAAFLTDKLKGAFEGISDAIGKVVGWIQSMIDKISNIKLPDWLTPGSPTPFEIGLRGISNAMEDINRTGLPALEAGINVNPVTTKQSQQQSIIDYDEMANTLAPVIARALRVEMQKV